MGTGGPQGSPVFVVHERCQSDLNLPLGSCGEIERRGLPI